jgi:hypothetical protein
MNFQRVADWNSKRYAQELSLPLQFSLHREEFLETQNAANEVERLDGHIDQVFVALGGIWKLGLDRDDACVALDAAQTYWEIMCLDDSYDMVMERIASHVTILEYALTQPATTPALVMVFASISALNYIALSKCGYEAAETISAAHIVCDSNDSKSIKKTASDVKANVDKGALFIAPEPRLQVIVDAMLARRQ